MSCERLHHLIDAAEFHFSALASSPKDIKDDIFFATGPIHVLGLGWTLPTKRLPYRDHLYLLTTTRAQHD